MSLRCDDCDATVVQTERLVVCCQECFDTRVRTGGASGADSCRTEGLLERCLMAARDAVKLAKRNPLALAAADEIEQRLDAIVADARESAGS